MYQLLINLLTAIKKHNIGPIVIDAGVIKLQTLYAASYLVRGKYGWTLIDADLPGYDQFFLWNLLQLGIDLSEIKNILLTHGHIDHVGGAQQIKQFTKAKIALGKFEKPIVSTIKSIPQISGRLGGIKRYFLKRLVSTIPRPILDIDIELYDNQDLSNFGLNGCVIETPGHTDGSVSFVLNSKFIFVGDIFQRIGSRIIPNTYADNPSENLISVNKLKRFRNHMFMPGHKNPFFGKEVFYDAN